jgi:hypothetical protein
VTTEGWRGDPYLRAYYWRLHDLAGTRSTRRRVACLRATATLNPSVDRFETKLWALMLVETSQRPGIQRGLEHVLRLLRPRTTTGPFQMRRAPFRFRPSVLEAADRLAATFPVDMPSDADLARYWGGSSDRQAGAAFNYEQALVIALEVVHQRMKRTEG